ncbi:hypothetical protein STANM309S_01394 [Streptomyces tanashiensis]
MTWIFDADVDAQGGAYATGVLVLICSAAIAVTIAARKAGQKGWAIGFGVISAVFLYTTVVNVIERPDGIRKIGACFIAGIILISLLSRLGRAFELRVTHIELDDIAARFIQDISRRTPRFIANEPDNRDIAEYRDKIEQIRADNDLPTTEDFVFIEVTITDPSEFEAGLTVKGEVLHDRFRVLTVEELLRPQRPRGPAPPLPRPHRHPPPHLLRVDRGQPLRQLPPLLPLRPGRDRPGHPRDPARGRVRPGPAPPRPRRLTESADSGGGISAPDRARVRGGCNARGSRGVTDRNSIFLRCWSRGRFRTTARPLPDGTRTVRWVRSSGSNAGTSDGSVRTVCSYCGVGYGIVLDVRRDPADGRRRAVKASGDKAHPANAGRLCTKGATSADMLAAPGRRRRWCVPSAVRSRWRRTSTRRSPRSPPR